MKRPHIHLILVVLAALLLLFILPVAAQNNTTSCTINADDPLASVLSVTFRRVTHSLTLPDDMLTLTCASTAQDIQRLAVSPSVPRSAVAPRPANPPGVPESQPGYAIVDTGNANLRSGPGPEYTRVAIVPGGSRLVVVGRDQDQSWWYVQAGEIRGWIWGPLLVLRGDLSAVPVVETAGEVAPAYLYVGYTGNPIYDELTVQGQVVCNIQGRSEYPIRARTQNSAWYLIDATCLDGTAATGWLPAANGIIRNPGGVRIPVVGQ